MNFRVFDGEYRVGLVFYDRDENYFVFFEFEVRLSDEFFFLVFWNRFYRGG